MDKLTLRMTHFIYALKYLKGFDYLKLDLLDLTAAM